MTWTLTVTGSVVDLHLAQPHQISVLDIAHALAHQCRFAGHTARHYSVAEHSLLVVEIIEREIAEHSPGTLLAALLHDAHEAYIGDITSPVKQALARIAAADGRTTSDWARIEANLQHDVMARFGCLIDWECRRDLIKTADLIALATERRDLMPASGPSWPVLTGVAPVGWINLRDRDGLTHADWRKAYIDKFVELYAMAADDDLEAQP